MINLLPQDKVFTSGKVVPARLGSLSAEASHPGHLLPRCRAKFMTREIHDYRGSAHARVMRMIAFGSYISQLDKNNTCVSSFGSGLASEIETNSSTDTT